MNERKIKAFQKLSRAEQTRRLVYKRIKEEGYTEADFIREYKASALDIKEFREIEAEIKRENKAYCVRSCR